MKRPALQVRTPALQRARGGATVRVKQVDGRTRLKTFYQEGCAKIRLPNTHDASLQAVLINTAGGLCGGDDITGARMPAPATALVLTTQACERVYRSHRRRCRRDNPAPSAAGAQPRLAAAGDDPLRGRRGSTARSRSTLQRTRASARSRRSCSAARRWARRPRRAAARRWRIRRNGRLIHRRSHAARCRSRRARRRCRCSTAPARLRDRALCRRRGRAPA